MSKKRSDIGARGEQLAVDFIIGLGYTILHRNYRRKFGEIDIIAQDRSTLVFGEVKTRSSDTFGSPAAAVTYRKQKQISTVAQDYLANNKLFDHAARFDVFSVVIGSGTDVQIEHIQNAFDLV